MFALCFEVLSAGCFQGTFTSWGIWVPIENADVSWMCYPGRSSLIPIRRALSPRISWSFSFILPYLSEMMFVDITLDCVVSQRPLCGTLVKLPWTLSLMFPYSRTMMIVLRRSLHSVVSDRNGLGIFVPLPPKFSWDLPMKQTLHWRLVWPNFVSQCCAHRVSLM